MGNTPTLSPLDTLYGDQSLALCCIICLRDCDLTFIYQLLYAFIGISYRICLQLTHELRLVTNLPGKSTPSHLLLLTRELTLDAFVHLTTTHSYYFTLTM